MPLLTVKSQALTGSDAVVRTREIVKTVENENTKKLPVGASSIVEIHPASCGSIFKLFPASQLDYEKKQNCDFLFIFSSIRPPHSYQLMLGIWDIL